MTDATILIPTYRHAALLPYAVRSALAQEDASIELFVVGDGVEDDTRAALEPFLSDRRVRFFDLPKGERHGELNRHAALAEASGRIVCYLSDDDLLLPGHVATMLASARGSRPRPQCAVRRRAGRPARIHPVRPRPGVAAGAAPNRRLERDRAHGRCAHARCLSPATVGLAAGADRAPNRPPHVASVPRAARLPGDDRHRAHVPELPEPDLGHASGRGAPRGARLVVGHDQRSRGPSSTAREQSAAHVRSRQRAAIQPLARRSRRAQPLERRHRRARPADRRLRAPCDLESTRTWRLRNRLLALRPVRALAARLPAAR